MATPEQQRAGRQKKAAQAAQAEVARLRATGDPALPMPVSGTKVSEKELAEYRERQALHRERHPTYDDGWERPTAGTAKAVWELLTQSLKKKCADDLTTKQALVVALDTAVTAVRHHEAVMVNDIFDTLAARWSDHFRQAREQKGVFQAWDMRPDTVIAARRDLLRNGIRLDALWRIVMSGQNPLYTVQRRLRRTAHGLRNSYKIIRRESPDLERFERLVEDDLSYRRQKKTSWRLLLAGEQTPECKVRQRISAEQPYNVVQLGHRSKKLLDKMEKVQLWFDPEAFRGDYERASTQDAAQSAAVSDQLKRLKPEAYIIEDGHAYVPVKSGFYRARNRRYHATHFWPEHASGKLKDVWSNEQITIASSLRGRWFKFATPVYEREGFELSVSPDHEGLRNLIGVDISASQTQVLAVFLGLRELEDIACSTEKRFNHYLAELAWPFLKDRYDSQTNKQLVALMKKLWMCVLYGSTPRQIILDQYDDEETFGPGWIIGEPAKDEWGAALSTAEKTILDLFRKIDGYDGVNRFLQACKYIGDTVDRYEGFVFADPFDEAVVRWNPTRRRNVPVSSGRQKVKVYVSLPNGKPKKAEPYKGDHPIHRDKLKRQIAPMLVHTLDAYFSSLVMERLAAQGIDFVALHDCWLTPTYIGDILDDAAKEWLQGLGSVYDRLIHYLGTDPTYDPFVHGIKANWEKRVQDKDWPHFVAGTSDAVEYS